MTEGMFPFGEYLKKVEQENKDPKKVFVLGVYASAVHAKWISPDGKEKVKALAVASEPKIFWKGDNADEIIKKIKIPNEAGTLEPADSNFNGPTGKILDEMYLSPLGFKRDEAWLCDLIPYSLSNKKQQNAIEKYYIPIAEKFNLPTASIPLAPETITIEKERPGEILKELIDSQAHIIIVLGQDPIKLFFHQQAFCKESKLSQFGEDKTNYGKGHSIQINNENYTVYFLAHPHHLEGVKPYSPKWKKLHEDWVTERKSKIKNI
jgi:hypothetical protein